MLCEEVELEKKLYVPDKYNYVFAAIDPKDSGFWIFSCSCNYSNDEIKSVPRYNLHDKIWIPEYKILDKCRRNFNKNVNGITICNHIKTCYISRIIVAQTQYNMGIPNWVKNFIGSDYYRKSMDTIRDIAPIPWGKTNGSSRHGIGRVKIYDYREYYVKLIKPAIGGNKWTCTCDTYNVWKTNCIHIYKVKLNEERLYNRRELCISLAKKYIDKINNITY